MFTEEIQDRNGNEIHDGDFVFTKVRGGSHEGKVETIVKNETSAREEGVPSYPKVIYTDQHGHQVAHNPSTVEKQNRRVFE